MIGCSKPIWSHNCRLVVVTVINVQTRYYTVRFLGANANKKRVLIANKKRIGCELWIKRGVNEALDPDLEVAPPAESTGVLATDFISCCKAHEIVPHPIFYELPKFYSEDDDLIDKEEDEEEEQEEVAEDKYSIKHLIVFFILSVLIPILFFYWFPHCCTEFDTKELM